MTEARIQQDIVRWARNTYCLKHHNPRSLILSIPNNNNPLAREIGMMAGASDLLFIYNPGGKIFWWEIKTPEGRQSPAQKVFQEHIRQLGAPHSYHIIRSIEEAQSHIQP